MSSSDIGPSDGTFAADLVSRGEGGAAAGEDTRGTVDEDAGDLHHSSWTTRHS